MGEELAPLKNEIAPQNNPQAVLSVEYVPRHLKMHNVSESELDALASGNPSVHLTFFGICFGAAVSFGTVVKATTNLDLFSKSLFSMLFVSAGLMALFFAVQSIRDYLQSKRKLQEIKSTHLLKKI